MQSPAEQPEVPLRVFIVEDSPTVRALLVEQLVEIPHVQVVGTAESEREARDALAQTPCDVLIADIQLREGTGLGVLRELANAQPAREQPATRIIFSNYVESEFRRLAALYGAQYFLDKATGFGTLLDIIDRLAADNRH
ncbi:MAG: response regulator [Gammaproteobacteria bacterium]